MNSKCSSWSVSVWIRVLVLATALVWSGRAMALTYHVALNGNDNPSSGTLANPWRTINYGVSQLSPGDTLLVQPGIYDESLLNAIPAGMNATNRVTVKALPQPGQSVILHPNG